MGGASLWFEPACQRPVDEGRLVVSLGAGESWGRAAHRDLSWSGDRIREAVREALEASGRFGFEGPSAPAGRLTLQIEEVERNRVDDAVRTSVRVELDFVPDSGAKVTVLALGRGVGQAEAADAEAVRDAISQAVEGMVATVDARSRSSDELQIDLHADDDRRSRSALDELTSRRDPAAFEPLVASLHQATDDEAPGVLAKLVSLGDPRAARVLIDEAPRRTAHFLFETFHALGALGGEEAEAYLFAFGAADPEPMLRAAAGEALARLRQRKTAVTAAP